jgi:hypothetical protein
MNELSQSDTLLSLRPDLAREWHPTRNGGVGPSDVSPRSRRKCGGFASKATGGGALSDRGSEGNDAFFAASGLERMINRSPSQGPISCKNGTPPGTNI